MQWSHKIIIINKSVPFYRPDALTVAQSTVPTHLTEKCITFHGVPQPNLVFDH